MATLMRKEKHKDVPNATTMLAIQEIENRMNAGVVNMKSLDDFIVSMVK